jgi:hypothetical protein
MGIKCFSTVGSDEKKKVHRGFKDWKMF